MAPKPPKEFHATKRLQREYEKAIARITKRVLAPKKPEQTLQEWLAEIAAKSQAQEVRSAAEFVAGRMVAQVNAKNARTWREAAARSQKTRRLYKLMQAELEGPVGRRLRQLRKENADYITSVAPVAAEMLTREITKAQLAGARPETIAKMARARFPQLLRSRVNLIARTETQKASAVLTRARAEHAGIHCYEWTTSEDQRVRKSHKKMNGVIVFYADPPEPERLFPETTKSGRPVRSTLGAYHAGECPNCRCPQLPCVDVDDIKFPARVYSRGAVRRVNKQEFLKIAASYGAHNTAAA